MDERTEATSDDVVMNHNQTVTVSPSEIPQTTDTSVHPHATDFEVGPIYDNGDNNNTNNGKNGAEQQTGNSIRAGSARSMQNLNGKLFSQRFTNMFSWGGQDSGQQPTSGKLNTLSAVTTLVCICLLFLYIAPLRSHATETEQESDHDSHLRSFNVKTLSFPILTNEEKRTYTWNKIQKLLQDTGDKKRLHIQVLNPGNAQRKHFGQPYISYKTDANNLKIIGRPNYCIKSDSETPENVLVSGTTQLHLSQMDGCHHYTNMILTRWKFPQVVTIKLHNMLIREQEFHALTKFIDRHNETLHRVEIDECIICPSPYCDAGLINFPDHDFQITITRRRESAVWI